MALEWSVPSPPDGVGKPCNPSTYVLRATHRHCTVDQACTNQAMNKQTSIAALDRIEHRTSKSGQDIAVMSGTEYVRSADVARVKGHSPTGGHVDMPAKVQAIEVHAPGGRNGHRDVCVAGAHSEGWTGCSRWRSCRENILPKRGRSQRKDQDNNVSHGSHRVDSALFLLLHCNHGVQSHTAYF